MLVIIRGPLGIGKSTVAKEIAKKLNAEYASVDKILENKKLDTIDKKLGKIPLKKFLLANKAILDMKNTNLVIDGNFYYKEQIEDLIKKSRNCKVFTLKAPLEECIRRDKLRKKSLGEKATKEVYNLASSFGYGTIINTENKTPNQVIKLIIKNLK